MKHARKAWLALSVILAVALLAGCGSIKIGMSESTGRGHWDLQYGTFTAREVDTFSAEPGDTLVFDYKVEVEKGELALSIEDPDGQAIFDLVLTEDARDTVRLPLDQGGRYTVVIIGKDTGGRTNLDWKVE